MARNPVPADDDHDFEQAIREEYEREQALEEVKRSQEEADRNEKEIEEHLLGNKRLPL